MDVPLPGMCRRCEQTRMLSLNSGTASFASKCGGGGGGDSEGYTALASFLSDYRLATTSESIANVATTTSGPETRNKTYNWTFLKGVIQPSLQWKSWETGVHKKVNNEWRWQSLVHGYITQEGTIIGGIITVVIDKSSTYIATYNAGVELNFSVTHSVIWKGSPINSFGIDKAYKTFNVNNDY